VKRNNDDGEKTQKGEGGKKRGQIYIVFSPYLHKGICYTASTPNLGSLAAVFVGKGCRAALIRHVEQKGAELPTREG
jgi:hypothetical protein